MLFTWKNQVKTMLYAPKGLCTFVLKNYQYRVTSLTTKYCTAMMLSDKELAYLQELENNQDVVYLLNTRECELISKLIKSYKEVKRQLEALQINQN